MRQKGRGDRRRRTLSGPRGMSLIETLLAVVLSGIIMIALLALYIEGEKYFFNQSSRSTTREEIRSDMALISRDIRDAANIADGPVTAFDGQEYSTDADCLVLELPSIDAAGQIIAGSMDLVIYSYDPGQNRLVKIVSPQAGVRQNQRSIRATSLIGPSPGRAPFILRYFNWDGLTEVTSAYADPDNGAFIVEVELTAQGRSIQRRGLPFVETFRTQAKMRNKVVPS